MQHRHLDKLKGQVWKTDDSSQVVIDKPSSTLRCSPISNRLTEIWDFVFEFFIDDVKSKRTKRHILFQREFQ